MMFYKAVGHNGAAQSPDAAAPDEGLDRQFSLRDLWPPVYRSRFPIMAIMVVALLLAIAATLMIDPVYRATASVEIRTETQKVLGTEDENETAASTADADRFLETQLDIIESRSTTAAVAQAMGLYDDPNFLESMGINAEVTGSEILSAEEARRQLVEDVLLDNLSATFPSDTRIAVINFESPDPRLAAQIANSYAENYIRLNLVRRFDATKYSLEFLRGQLREAQARLGESERRALAYARRSRIIDANPGSPNSNAATQSLTTASLVQLNEALSAAVSRRLAAEQKWRETQSANALNVPEVLSNPAVQQLMGERAQLESQLSEQRERRQDEFPAIRQATARLAELNQQLNGIAGSVRSSIREDYEVARAQEAALQGRVEALKSSSLDEQSRGIQLSILRREANTNRAQLDALLMRYNELNAQSGVQLNNLSIIDRAETPVNPVWPNLILNVALALVFGALLSGLYILGRENLFQMIRTPEDIATRLRLPFLGSVPPTEMDVPEALADTKSPVAEAFSSIRTSLALSSPRGAPQSMMFTSTQAGEGKTTTCYGIAVGLSRIGRRVIIVDADLRRPNVHKVIGIANNSGTSNVLAGESRLDQVILKDVLPGVDCLAAGPIPPNPTELLASGELPALVAELETRYDHVLVDSAPLLGLADAPIIASGVKAIIFVIEASRTSARGAVNALTRLGQANTPFAGVILSRFAPDKLGYDYQYEYSYGDAR